MKYITNSYSFWMFRMTSAKIEVIKDSRQHWVKLCVDAQNEYKYFKKLLEDKSYWKSTSGLLSGTRQVWPESRIYNIILKYKYVSQETSSHVEFFIFQGNFTPHFLS